MSMRDMRTAGVPYVTGTNTKKEQLVTVPATASVESTRGLGHGVHAIGIQPEAALAAVPGPGQQYVLRPGSVSVEDGDANATGYGLELWFRRGSRSLQATTTLSLFGLQQSLSGRMIQILFLLPNCIRFYFNSDIILPKPLGNGRTPQTGIYMTQVCDAALASARWHQVVVVVQRGGSARIYLNGNEGAGWVGGLPCENTGMLNTSVPGPTDETGGRFCGDLKRPIALGSVPAPVPADGIVIGEVPQTADFGSVAHVALYSDPFAAQTRLNADEADLPAVSGGRQVVLNTSQLSFFLGRPTSSIVCDDPEHVVGGGPVQRVWMGAWSGPPAPASVACGPDASQASGFFWPWAPPLPSGADPAYWGYRSVVSVPINFSPADYPPGSVDEDGLRIDLEEEVAALLVHIDPARVEANLVNDDLLLQLRPPALRLRVTFTPPRPASPGIAPWGPEPFHRPTALNSAIAAGRQLVEMLSSPDESIFGDRMWEVMPGAPGGITFDTQAPCPNAEDGYALACTADHVVQPGFIAAAVVAGSAIILVIGAALGYFDACCPSPTAALAALRAIDPGFDERPPAIIGESQAKTGSADSTGSIQARKGTPARSAKPAAPTLAAADAAWTPAVTDNRLIQSLRAIRDGDWPLARSMGRLFAGGSVLGPGPVPAGTTNRTPMTSAETAVVVRAALRSPRSSMVLVPAFTAAVVLLNALVLAEFCLEQNEVGAIFISVGLLGWLANNAVAACARHSSLYRPLWERGEGAPARSTCCLAPVACCFFGPSGGSPDFLSRVGGVLCTLAFCWPCCRRCGLCRGLCGDGGPVACARDTCGLGCCFSRGLVRMEAEEGAARGDEARGEPSVSRDSGASWPARGSDQAASEWATAGAGGSVTGTAARRQRREWAHATVSSTGLCGCVGSELVRGLMRRNGDSGAEEWQRSYGCVHAVGTLVSLLLGPVWLQVHMSRAFPWGCCSQTWAIDAEYVEAGADVLRRQTLVGALLLGLSVVVHAFVTLVASSTVSATVVPARWTSHVNVGVTLVWLLYLVISALFSRFAAVDDDEASGYRGAGQHVILGQGTETDASIGMGSRDRQRPFMSADGSSSADGGGGGQPVVVTDDDSDTDDPDRAYMPASAPAIEEEEEEEDEDDEDEARPHPGAGVGAGTMAAATAPGAAGPVHGVTHFIDGGGALRTDNRGAAHSEGGPVTSSESAAAAARSRDPAEAVTLVMGGHSGAGGAEGSAQTVGGSAGAVGSGSEGMPSGSYDGPEAASAEATPPSSSSSRTRRHGDAPGTGSSARSGGGFGRAGAEGSALPPLRPARGTHGAASTTSAARGAGRGRGGGGSGGVVTLPPISGAAVIGGGATLTVLPDGDHAPRDDDAMMVDEGGSVRMPGTRD